MVFRILQASLSFYQHTKIIHPPNRLMPKSAPPFLGVDLGGTNIQCGLVGQSDKGEPEVLTRAGTKTRADKGSDAVIDRIVKLARKVLDNAGVKAEQVGGLGIGAPGAIDMGKGVVLRAPNLGWDNFPLGKRLKEEMKLEVVVDNDVNVGAWGEFKAGAARAFDSSLAVFVGTGIGGGLIFDGKLFHGHHTTAGEIGHTVIKAGAGLGRRTMEDLASRTNMVKHITTLIEAGHPSKMVELTGGDMTKVRSKLLATAFKKKDPLTVKVVQEAAAIVGVGIANAVTLLSLPCVVVGGGATEALGEPWMDLIRKSFREHVFPAELRDCKIVASQLQDDAGVMGAALLARDRVLNELKSA